MKWRIREDLKVRTFYGKCVLNWDMEKYLGDTFEATEEDPDYGFSYRGWNWTKEMLIPVIDEPKFKIGDKLSVKGSYEEQGDYYTYIATTSGGQVITLDEPNTTLRDSSFLKCFIWHSIMNFKKIDTTVKLTKQEIADKIGVNVNDLQIVE